MKKYKIGILVHIFYEDEAPLFLKMFLDLKEKYDAYLLVSSSNTKVLSFFKDEVVSTVLVENRGKDIVGKLALIDSYLKSGKKYDILIFAHDKKSPQKEDRERVNRWRDELLKILKPDVLEKAISKFNKDPNIGMIGSHENHVKVGEIDTDHEYKNREISSHKTFMGNLYHLKEFSVKFGLNNFETHKYDFISGTMFIVRAKIFEEFFIKINIESLLLEFENGDVQNNKFLNDNIRYSTKTHAFERIFGWIPQSLGYSVSGI